MNLKLIHYITLLLFSLTLMSPSCEKEQEIVSPKTGSNLGSEKKEMAMLQYEFQGDYEDLWNAVDSLQKLGLYKSALQTVNTIYEVALEEDNAPQVVKSVIHRMKFNSYMTEDDYVVAINDLNALSKDSEFPLKQIIHSITAESYWVYYQANRWKFLNRTQTTNFENDDVRTWDLNKIAHHVNKHYMLSLSSKDSLQHTSIKDFKSILLNFKTDDLQRPTLYDFLAHRALSFFVSTEPGITRPEDKFIIKGISFFGNSEAFLKTSTTSKDSMSNALHATRIFKELTRLHIKDKEPSALIDLTMSRLKYAHHNSVEEKRGELYLAALNALAEKYAAHKGYAEIRFLCASYFNTVGSKYTAQNKEHQWEKKKAVEICDEAIQKYPNSHGAEQCKGLKISIEQKSITFNSEMAYSPNSKGKVLLNFKNIDSLYFKMVKVDWDYFYNQPKYGYELMEELLKKSPIQEWNKAFKNPGDYQSHSTEVAIDVPDYGQYVILASTNKNFDLKKNAIAYSSFWSSNLSYTYRRNDDETIDVYVANRETGKPLANVKANVLVRKYNAINGEYEAKKQESYRSDNNGMFTIKSHSEYRYIYVDLTLGSDQYNNSSQLYQYRPYNSNKSYNTTYFFTDRSIYRPGQTIYFKGIRIKHNGDAHKLDVNQNTTVSLYDANYQKVADLNLTTNEYGTFSGSFTAPTGVLNGQMRIQDKYGSKYFSVEEYKRPKFEVEFEPIAGEFNIGQEIKTTAAAKAYAGSNLDGAKVQYRVVRSATFPYWTYYRWGFYPYSQSIEVTNGITKTDENGNFNVSFLAREDPSIDKKYYPNYSYTITADVTDVNGETHSSSQYVMVGYNCMSLSVGLPAIIERNAKNRFRVATTNLMGEKLNANGTIKVSKLIEPDGTFRTSNWAQPDIQEFTKEQYRELFPHDTYGDELDVTKFEKGEQVLKINFDTAAEDSIDFNGMDSWKPGKYIVEASSIDKFGQNVKDIHYITLVDKNSTKNPTNDIWFFTPLKNYCEPGEKAEFLISSAERDLNVYYEIEHKGKIISKKMIQLSQGQKMIQIPILEKHRGNITVHFNTIKFGRTYTTKQPVTVPYSNKVLDVEFETFRNKMLPGSKEEWKVKIKGPKGEKVAAEMLATMYDASLDAFASNAFYMQVFNSYYSSKYWSSTCFGQAYSQLYNDEWNKYYSIPHRSYDQLNWWGYNNHYRTRNYNGYYKDDIGGLYGAGSYNYDMDMAESEEIYFDAVDDSPNAPLIDGNAQQTFSSTIASGNTRGDKMHKLAEGATTAQIVPLESDNRSKGLGQIKARTNLNETAFFFPQLETNAEGEVIFKFTMPEALTKWKFLGMAHTKDLKVGYLQEEVVTQKELMVVPNAPRFLREGDRMTFTAKVSNLSEKDLSGTAQLMLFDALSMQPIDSLFNNKNASVDFTAKKGQSAPLAWKVEVPFGIGAVTYRVVARAENFTDGEEMALPVLSNRMLITESLPLPSKGIGTDEFTFTKLVNSESSSSIKHHRLTLEYTSNPAWYAVQAMPYMMEYPYECAEQIFTRFYSNSLASNIMNSSPKIKNVFESWKQSSPDAFLSNLEKNQELKSLMLEEIPWVLDAKNESERKKRIGLLFDLNKMDNELSKAIRKLKKMQIANGGWPWFPGMEESRYITQHVVTGMGHLDHLNVKNVREDKEVWTMTVKAISYLDQQIIKDYEWLKAHDIHYLDEQRISNIQVQYLYARSYFIDLKMNDRLKEAFDYYQNQAATYWKNFNLYNEGMIALQAKRYEIETLPSQIMASIKERAILHEELGMYWKDNVSGWYWYQAPIETQALLIEAFDEVSNDMEAVEEMKVWLLKQKQTTDWKTTKATAEACYALLLRGTELLANDEMVEIKINGEVLDPRSLGSDVEAGTGYFKTSWTGNEIKPEMGNISVTRSTKGVSWGAMYWQYFEDLDKITTHETSIKLKKKLFLVTNTASGPTMSTIEDDTKLQPGDKVRVRIELRTDRDMEYVHLKDMRAAGFEPINVFSRYKWQDGLGYYESTKDAATNFFMDYVRKGTYVFEYDLRVSHAGDFSNGISTIQCMYAPEFTSHSEGIRVKIEEME